MLWHHSLPFLQSAYTPYWQNWTGNKDCSEITYMDLVMKSFIQDVKKLWSYSIGDLKVLKVLEISLISTVSLWAHTASFPCDYPTTSPCSESMDCDFEEDGMKEGKTGGRGAVNMLVKWLTGWELELE